MGFPGCAYPKRRPSGHYNPRLLRISHPYQSWPCAFKIEIAIKTSAIHSRYVSDKTSTGGLFIIVIIRTSNGKPLVNRSIRLLPCPGKYSDAISQDISVKLFFKHSGPADQSKQEIWPRVLGDWN
ncbi:uncharacterized protein CIMG_13061 [Coccidioides immitis RS]|uniref:Uncharacterized protein n=1 Tax=Coccidioides immitis (strain RS) TaxID=246410 RepID=A0A0D8JTX3_COCIM|nr:uncharacterized protein CIMG_13061 [Coccidioides immitis RS]KJF60589.1 hypothetical protein CIMG_13061 [Coccidioides immitis RS]